MLNHKHLLSHLPSSWEQLKLKDFIKLLDIIPTESDIDNMHLFVGMDNTLQVIAKLADTTIEELEELPIQQVGELANHVAFLSSFPETQKHSSIQWKQVDEVTYNDFVLYSNLSQQPNGVLLNLPIIIEAFAKNKITKEQVMELNMVDCFTGFFLLEQTTKKFSKRTIKSFRRKLIKQMLMNRLTRLKQMLLNKGKACRKFMVGFGFAKK